MQRIIIPTHYVHTRSTPLWTKETARPLSGAAIWMPAPAGRLPSSLGDAGGDPLSRLCR